MGVPYIAARRARFDAICGRVNIPCGTTVEEVQAPDGAFLVWNGRRLCATTSQKAHDLFARNDDGNGLERGRLTAGIVNRLSKTGKDHQKRWDRMWEDTVANKYRRKDHADFWVWNHDFFGAPLEDLHHMAALIGLEREARR